MVHIVNNTPGLKWSKYLHITFLFIVIVLSLSSVFMNENIGNKKYIFIEKIQYTYQKELHFYPTHHLYFYLSSVCNCSLRLSYLEY